MDRIRTLLLARSHTVVLDPDHAARAATRPIRDSDIDQLEDLLAQLGFVMSLDLAMAVRRLPSATLHELARWIVETLAPSERPRVPLVELPGAGGYLRRIAGWLATDQPCPWCGQLRPIGALDPCGHLVCRACWAAGNFAGCPLCHRRVAIEPFARLPAGAPAGRLALVHLGYDLQAAVRAWLGDVLGRTTPLALEDRDALDAAIDAIGPRLVEWLPARIPVRETMALALARLWQIAPDPSATAALTAPHLRRASDVLRVAVVLLGGDARLAEPTRLGSISRALRRAVLEALDRLPPAQVAEDVARRRELWKRVGERLHPGEHAALANAARAFAIARGRERVARWGAPIERALAAGDAATAAAHLAARPGRLLRRADHLVRVAAAGAPGALSNVLAQIARAIAAGSPATLLVLARHVEGRRGALPDAAIAAIAGGVRDELLARADARRHFARAVIDRALADLRAPIASRSAVFTCWELACIHAAARATTIYVRERDGSVTTFRRRDAEPGAARLERLLAGTADSFRLAAIPAADAPTWAALAGDDLALPPGSVRATADELLAELTSRS